MATDTSQYESRVYWNTGEHGGKHNHWLRMRFAGVTDAQLIGARVEADVDGRKQDRSITVSQSYKSGGALEAHFGLAGSKSADIPVTLLDGRTIAIPGIAADRYVEIDLAMKTVTPVQATRPAAGTAASAAAPQPALKLDIADTVFELVVRDPITVTKFYRDGLGMREVEPANQQTGAVLEWAGSLLKIRPVAGPAPAAPTPQSSALCHFELIRPAVGPSAAKPKRLRREPAPQNGRFSSDNPWLGLSDT